MRIKLMLFFAILASFFVGTTHGYCSLEKMKTFAREACERLFQQDEGRERRSLDYSHHRHVNELMHGKSHKHEHFIGRSSFPKGGYLKVSKAHYHKLVNLDVKPRYKPRKHPEMKSRFRRDNSIQAYKGISYCCFHQCDEDFFC